MPGSYARVAIEPLENRLLCASIAVNLNQKFQTIDGFGGNYARGRFGDFYIPSNDTIGQYTLDNLHPQHARVGLPLRGWEPTNDDADPNVINMDGFGINTSAIINVFTLMQDLRNRGIPITASVWDAPNWMLTEATKTKTTQRHIAPELFSEFIESIGAFLKRAQDTYGVRVDYLSFNEANDGYNLRFTSQDEETLIAQAGQAFSKIGLSYTPKWLVGDTGNALRLVNFVTPILNDPAAAPYLGPITFHGWDSLTYADSTFTDIAALGKQFNKPIWCEEIGYDATAWQKNPSPFPTWTYALNLSQVYYKIMKLAGATGGDYWELQNDYPVMQSGSPFTLYPSYYIINSMFQNFTPGTQMVSALSDTSTVLTIAGAHPASGRIAVEAINTSTTASQTTTISGLPAGTVMNLVRSSSTENGASIGTFTADSNGKITVSLPASSVNMLWGVRGSARPVVRAINPPQPTAARPVPRSLFSLLLIPPASAPLADPVATSSNSSSASSLLGLLRLPPPTFIPPPV